MANRTERIGEIDGITDTPHVLHIPKLSGQPPLRCKRAIQTTSQHHTSSGNE